MGKSKKRSRASRSRLNPLSNNNGNDSNNNRKDANLITKKIEPLLNNLKSAIANDRSMALNSISVLCEDPHLRGLLLREKLIQIILSNLLNDENTDIVVESFGLLRNLTLEEGYDVSVYLWRSDIWISIKSGFEKLTTSLHALNESSSDNGKNGKESKRLLFDFADNLLSLIVALCNGSNDILTQILTTDKLQELFAVIIELLKFGIDKLPIQLFNTILDLIYDLSTESFEFIDAITQDDVLSEFIMSLPVSSNTIHPKSNSLTEVLIQGIYLQFLDNNVTYDQGSTMIVTLHNTIAKLNLNEIQKDLSTTLQDDELSSMDNSKMTTKIKDYAKRRSAAQMKLQSIEIGLDIITATIEIIASVHEASSGKISIPDNLIQCLVDMVPELFIELFDVCTARCLIGWNNLLWLFLGVGFNFFELKSKDNGRTMYKSLWDRTTALNDDEYDNGKDLGVLIGKYSVIWVLLKITSTMQETPLNFLKEFGILNNVNFVNQLIEKFNKWDDVELKQRLAGILSCLGSFQGQDLQLNEIIGKFFLEQCCNDKVPISVVNDLLNFIFEMYCDGNFDYDGPVFVNNEFASILKEKVAPTVKDRFKFVDKNKEPELKERCNETFNTLNSFIQYKETEKS
ncbi:hypothetical protein NCAS_0A02480 [Naumovozyma castellii]|uniref:SYO1-like TPR repeats domain-containing protein n=1 Tax=Naumovozyma castellii TaxID=27288 RepID=G0V5R8_NAUCA|nr:hypothetical protein NCAS_0A02480 [Naumovozyma castellii CBS 4309]CCC66806.1 hypothetical protein NCAS_0A02480 [Naumovozyma castellii CBS 4309]